ncbi:MAG: ankyrin repeat domain-containing protein [bacterium]|nr:ankyrin repeat domain-containing protein [bacterium]
MNIFARIMVGDVENYAKLIQATDINLKDEDGASLLRIAIAYSSEEIALDLLSRGIEINQADGKGSNELQNAFWKGFWSLGVELVKRGADLHHRNKHGNNALWYASTHPKVDYNVVRLLVENGSDVHTKNVAGRSPLDAAKERGQLELVEILENSSPNGPG